MRSRGSWAGLALATSSIAWAGAAEAGETVVYSYDSLGRLIRVERAGSVNNGVTAAYSYDPADNRTNVTVDLSGSPTTSASSSAAPFSSPLSWAPARSRGLPPPAPPLPAPASPPPLSPPSPPPPEGERP